MHFPPIASGPGAFNMDAFAMPMSPFPQMKAILIKEPLKDASRRDLFLEWVLNGVIGACLFNGHISDAHVYAS